MITNLGKSTIATIIIASVVGCSSPTEANKDNFKAAINDFYEVKKECIDIGKLPITTPESKDYSVVDELEKLGFLQAEETQMEYESAKSLFGLEDSKQVPALKYSLTPKGESIASIDAREKVSFCYARYEVVEIVDFTEPTESDGYTISRVNYDYKIGDIAEWAKTSTFLQDNNYSLKQAMKNEVKKGSTVLVKMNDKWKHGRLVK